MYTTAVDAKSINTRYPWFLQEKIDAEADVTIQIVGGRQFAFSRSRKGMHGLDWRKEIFTENHERAEWLPFRLNEQQQLSVTRFVTECHANWGRIDFLLQGEKLVFLEFNANGQWAFLDHENRYGLLDAVVAYLVG